MAGLQGAMATDKEGEMVFNSLAYVFKFAVALSKTTRAAVREHMRLLDAGHGAPQPKLGKSGSGKSGSVNKASLSKNFLLFMIKILELPEDQAMFRNAMKKVRTGAAMHAPPFQLLIFYASGSLFSAC